MARSWGPERVKRKRNEWGERTKLEKRPTQSSKMGMGHRNTGRVLFSHQARWPNLGREPRSCACMPPAHTPRARAARFRPSTRTCARARTHPCARARPSARRARARLPTRARAPRVPARPRVARARSRPPACTRLRARTQAGGTARAHAGGRDRPRTTRGRHRVALAARALWARTRACLSSRRAHAPMRARPQSAASRAGGCRRLPKPSVRRCPTRPL